MIKNLYNKYKKEINVATGIYIGLGGVALILFMFVGINIAIESPKEFNFWNIIWVWLKIGLFMLIPTLIILTSIIMIKDNIKK